MMKKNFKILAVFLTLIWGNPSDATVINTGNYSGTNTNAIPLDARITATPRAMIRLDVGGAKFTGAASPLTLSITVDCSTPAVTVGTAADQAFRDDAIGAAYFGYYISLGVRSAGQAAANVNLKVRRGAGETAGRSYYLLGNGATIPNDQGDLTVAPAAVTTFATSPPNVIRCGPSYAANGISGTAINCAAGSTVANMDITQFAKILYSDPIASARISQLEFTAVNE
jgi:hypothetical protein